VLTAILGAALQGIDKKADPAAPVQGDAFACDLPKLPTDWGDALDAFEASTGLDDIFAPILRSVFIKAKRQELARFAAEVSSFEYRTYLNTA